MFIYLSILMKISSLLLLGSVFIVSCNSNPEVNETANSQTAQQEQPAQNQTQSSTTVSDAQQRLRDRNQQNNETATVEQRYRLDVPPYNHYLNSDGYLQLVGQTDASLDEILGAAPVVVRQAVDGAPLRREVRVYFPYEEDSTGLFIYIRNNTVEKFRMDTFLGLANSEIIQEYFQN
jgi:phenylalanyl-tRNA synthetase alpha subunit